jgi:hypothetical protein
MPVGSAPGTGWIGGWVDKGCGRACAGDGTATGQAAAWPTMQTSEELVNKTARSIRRRVGADMLRYDAGARARAQ